MAQTLPHETPKRDQVDRYLDQVVDAVPDGKRVGLCLQCGACSGICPHGFAMDYPPRSIIAAARARDFSPVVDSDSIWLCMSCFACTGVCPAKIPLTHALLSALKAEKLLAASVPEELKVALENSRRYGNTLGESPRKRSEWARDFTVEVPVMARHEKPVDVLWYVGDYGSYHPRVQRVTRAFAKLMHALDVSFGILGPEEHGDGDVQYLAGERGLFELLAHKNAKMFAKYDFKSVVTADAHAYNAFKNEYPELGYDVPVKHHTQFLFEHLDRLEQMFKHEQKLRVTYHDPCAIGRAHQNSVYDEPRMLLAAIPGVQLVEMPHNRENSICCGGGGGGMWLDGFVWERTQARTSEWRVAEAVRVGAQVLAVSCPFETPRFEDAVKGANVDGGLAVKDVAELVADAVFG